MLKDLQGPFMGTYVMAHVITRTSANACALVRYGLPKPLTLIWSNWYSNGP